MNYLRYYFKIFSIVLFSMVSFHVLEGSEAPEEYTLDELQSIIGINMNQSYSSIHLQQNPFIKKNPQLLLQLKGIGLRILLNNRILGNNVDLPSDNIGGYILDGYFILDHIKKTLGTAGIKSIAAQIEKDEENERKKSEKRRAMDLKIKDQELQFELDKKVTENEIQINKIKYEAGKDQREEENQQKIKEITTRIDVFFSNLVSPKFGLVMVGIFGGIIFVWFFSKYGIPKLLNPPPALVKESTLGFWNRFKKRPKSRKNELVYPPHIEQRLMGLIAEMKALVALKMQGDPIAMKMLFSDFLLLGASGVGKTALAKVVAIEAGFDYVIIDGPRLSQLEEKEALKFLYSLLQRASTNKRPVLIFLDESNSILPRRGSASILDSKVTNAWLGAVESGNHPNILVVYSTNLLEEMDTAVIDRLEIIHIPMPDREEIFRIFFEKNIQRKSEKMGISLSPEIRKSKEEISDALHGFSGRGAKKISVNLLRKAYFNKGKKLTNAMVMEEIEQHQFKKREAAKRALERKA